MLDLSKEEKLIKVLKKSGVVVMPTDTVFGVLGRAENPAVVERIYKVRGRDENKPCIILIANIKELQKFSINITEAQKNILEKYWNTKERATSIILDCLEGKFAYLHRGTNTLAFRLPQDLNLRNLLLETGPLIAPSANPQGLTTAKNTEEAKNYFGDLIDLYVKGEENSSKPSRVIRLFNDGTITIIRE